MDPNKLRVWLEKAKPPPLDVWRSLLLPEAVRSLRQARRYLRQFSTTLIAGYCVGTTVFTLVGYPAQVNGKSMQPSLNFPLSASPLRLLGYDLLSDWVWVSTWRGRQVRSIHRGEVVVFTSPKDPPENVIKRLVGVEGDVVTPHSQAYLEEESVHIPTGNCWVEGDNWLNSVDSNKYGPIPMGLIFGVATHVVWPPNRWQKLQALPPTKDRVITPVRKRR